MPERATKTKATCASCGGAIRAKDRFCPTCGTPIAAAQAARSATTSASLQVTAETADALLEQRKVVTIVFADLSGSTPLAEKLDPEELRTILSSYFGSLARQIRRYEGTIDKYIGDAIMAVFGAPISHEDDAERAVHAALAMQASIVRLNDDLDRVHGVRLSLRIGVNTGEVVAGLLAGDVQRAYTVVGDAVNTAQRLESAAPLGQVLVSETTRRLAMHRFEFERRDPIVLKGKSEPVITYRVVRELDWTIEPDATRFVGREGELARLTVALDRARSGQGSVIAIVGEPGVGKSRLVAEFRNALPPQVDRMTARCASYEQSTPYALIADFIRGAFGIHAADEEKAARAGIEEGLRRYGQPADPVVLAVVLEIIGYQGHSVLDPERKGTLLVGFLRAVLACAAARAPFLLVAEDFHWADDASLRVVGELVGEASSLPCLFVTTSRPGWVPPWEAEQVELTALDDADSRALINGMLDFPVDAALADQVVERTSGNPFFIEEVVRSLTDGLSATMPMSVQELLEARVDALEPNPRLVAQSAAVIGRVFPTRVLERVAPVEMVYAALDALEAERLVERRESVPEPTYAFRHPLVQEVVYKMQLVSQRRRAHVAVGDAISALHEDRLTEFVDALAYHYGRGDDDAKASSALLRAGRRAQHLYANEEALAYFRGAIERSAEETETRSHAYEGCGDVRRVTGVYRESLENYEAALTARVDGSIERGRIRRKIGVIEQLLGHTDAAAKVFAQVVAELPDGPHAERALALLNLGDVYWRQGRYSEALTQSREAVAEAERAGDIGPLAEALKQLGSVYLAQGDLDHALESYERSCALYATIGDVLGEANVLNNIGLVRRHQSRYADALAAHQQALAIRRRVGDPLGVGNSRLNVGFIDLLQGDLEAAEAEYREALTVFGSLGYVAGIASARNGLGVVKVERGDVADGRHDLLAALQEFEDIGNRSDLVTVFRDLAEAYVRDDPAAALEWARRALDTAEALGSAEKRGVALQILGITRAATADHVGASAALEESRALLQLGSDRLELARTLSALGRAYAALPQGDSRRQEAARCAEVARATFRELGARLELRRLDNSVELGQPPVLNKMGN